MYLSIERVASLRKTFFYTPSFTGRPRRAEA